jgi:hypothetical protein
MFGREIAAIKENRKAGLLAALTGEGGIKIVV